MQIEKNIPMPKSKNRGKWKDLLEQMEVGDSILVDSFSQFEPIRRAAYTSRISVINRLQEDGKVRFWVSGRKEKKEAL